MMGTRTSRGFTILEVTVVMALTSLVVAAVMQAFSSSEGLATDSRVTLRAHEELRRNLEAVANVLRDVDETTLGGFGSLGVATQPSFRRVTGADRLGRTFGPVERIEWRTAPRPANGVAAPGRLMLVRGTQATLLADRVPQGGFRVLLQGGQLVVELQTYWSVSAADVVTVSGRTSTSLRN